MTLAEAAAHADALAQDGDERALAVLRHSGTRRSKRRLETPTTAFVRRLTGDRAVPVPTEARALRRGLEDESPAARGSALIALEGLSRNHPGDVNAFRAQLHELAARDPNAAVRRLAVICLKNGTPQRDTIQLLEGIAESEDTDPELRKTARVVHAALKKKAVSR